MRSTTSDKVLRDECEYVVRRRTAASRSQRGRGTFYARENSSSTLVHFHPSLADPSEYKLRARLNPYLVKIFPINGFQSSQTAIVENTAFADAMNRRNCPHPVASTESMSSLSPETQARPRTPSVVWNLLYPVVNISLLGSWLERREE